MRDNLYHRFIDELATELGSTIPDASRLRRSATRLRADWSRLQAFFSAVVSDPAIVASVARHSYWHANGFAKLVLHEEPGFSLRLHIWPAEGSVVDANVHTHRWEFASLVLCGGLVIKEFEETRDIGDPGARRYDKYEYASPTKRTMGQLRPLGARALRTAGSAKFAVGEVHHCDLATIHAVTPFESTLTATLFVQGPAMEPAALVYQEEGLAPLDDTGIGATPDEVVQLVEETLHAMSHATTGQMRSLAEPSSRRSRGQTMEAALADHEIVAAIAEGSLKVEPFHDDLVRPAALSLRLGTSAYVLRASGPVDAADGATHPELVRRDPDEHDRLVVEPGEVVLAPTLERITVANTLVGILDGISDVARLGISVVLASQVSPGFGAPNGAVLTLEIVNHLQWPIYLRPATRICNLMLLRCARPVRPYSSTPHNHSDDLDAMPSRLADQYAAAGFAVHTAPLPALGVGR